MRRINTILMLLVGLTSLNAQVGINTNPPHATAALDMSESTKGFLAPRIALLDDKDTSTITEPRRGLLIFNTTSNSTLHPGYYYWNNTKWEPFYNTTNEVVQNTSQTIFASSLGYVPSGTAAEAPEIFSFDGISSTGRTCIDFTDSYTGAIAKTYCGYSLDTSVSWEQAFNFAKLLKGYLATITSTEEWDAIRNNLLTIGGNSNSNVWIGYNILPTPGNPNEYTWITGEKSVINWSNNSVLQVNYAPGEPNGTTGCVHIADRAYSATRNWYNTPCTTTTANGFPFNFIIVEFHN